PSRGEDVLGFGLAVLVDGVLGCGVVRRDDRIARRVYPDGRHLGRGEAREQDGLLASARDAVESDRATADGVARAQPRETGERGLEWNVVDARRPTGAAEPTERHDREASLRERT